MVAMPRTTILLFFAALLSGCKAQPKHPLWEVSINIGVTDKINPAQTVTGALTLKRVLPLEKKP